MPLLQHCTLPYIIALLFFLLLLFVVNYYNVNDLTPMPNNTGIYDIPSNIENIINLKHNIKHIMQHLHNKNLSELSPELQSRKLQQIFQYKFNELLLQRSSNKGLGPPSGHEVVKLMSDIYARHKSELNFIQIGACDGNWELSNDPIQKLLLHSLHWHGVMMEPVPFLFEKLKKSVLKSIVNHKQRIYLLNAALSDTDSIQKFYIINDLLNKELPNATHAMKYQLGSFDKQHLIKHLNIGKRKGELSLKLDDYITSIDVQCMTPMTVVKKFRDESGIAVRNGMIDILLIDAEGYDFVVLQSFMKIYDIRPSLIIYEHVHINRMIAANFLNSYGYITIKAKWNTFGVHVAEL